MRKEETAGRIVTRSVFQVSGTNMLANLSNVLVVFVLARSLSSSDYGSYTQLMAIFLFVSITGTALTVSIVRTVRFGRVESLDTWRRGFLESLRFSLLVGLIFFVGLAYFLSYELPGLAVLPTVLVLLGGLEWLYLCAVRGFLQAERNYQTLANSFLLESGLRVVLVLGSARAGLALVAASYVVMALILSLHSTNKNHWMAIRSRPHDPVRIWRSSLPIIICYLSFIALMYLDIVIVGHRLPGHRGSYGAISQMSKFIVYGAFALGSLVIAEVERPAAESQRWRNMSVAIAGIYLLLVCTLLVAVKYLGSHLISISFGAAYTTCSGSLVPLSVGMCALGVTILVANRSLGLGDSWPVSVATIGAACVGLYVWSNARSVDAIATAEMWAQLALMCLVCVLSVAISYRGAGERV